MRAHGDGNSPTLRNPGNIEISCDAKNAFNSWCRSRLWDPLLANFPSLYTLLHLMYGEAADVFFLEDQSGFEKIVNEVGSRQG